MSRGDELAQVLDAARAFLTRYVVLPTAAAADALVLWVAHCHAIDAFDTTPRVHVKSAQKGSGKTRLQEGIELLVPRPLAMVNISVPALFRSIPEAGAPPTIIMDEVDTIFGAKAPDGSEDLRGLLNAGHRRGRPVRRCVGPRHEVAEFPSFAPVCLAGIGDLPDTIEDRSITILMRRRAPDEHVEPFRWREAEAEARPIAEWFSELTDWMVTNLDGVYPQLPPWLTDRPADCWEPLIAVADLASGEWGERARDAARTLLDERTDHQSLGVRLLAEIRDVFGTDEAVWTATLLDRLRALDESPWGEWGITARWLAQHLRPFSITSTNVRIGERQAKGYRREDFADTWTRYLPEVPSQASQAHEQHEHGNGAVPGTDTSVPTSQAQLSEQGWDGGTDGTAIRPDDVPRCVRQGGGAPAGDGTGGLCSTHHAALYLEKGRR